MEEDILELFPNVNLEDIQDDTEFNTTQRVINIFNALVAIGEDIDTSIQRIQRYICHPIINEYMYKVKQQYFE